MAKKVKVSIDDTKETIVNDNVLIVLIIGFAIGLLHIVVEGLDAYCAIN